MNQGNDQTISIENLRRMLDLGRSVSLRSLRTTCIYRVPREMSMPKSLFEPSLVALGPFHHRNPKLKAMEEHKLRLALKFFQRSEARLDVYFTRIKEIEETLRSQYEGGNLLEFSSDEFVSMMVIDGAYLIEFIIRYCNGELERIDTMHRKKWALRTVDILLLENQLPVLLLKELLNIAGPIAIDGRDLSIYDLIETFLVILEVLPTKKQELDPQEFQSVHTLIAFFPVLMEAPRNNCPDATFLALPSSPTISQLYHVGVRFKRSQQKNAEITFSNGILEISTLIIGKPTEKVLANLLAYEMADGEVHDVSDYVAMMDLLINGPEDIKILTKYGILTNFLKDHEAASNLINHLGTNIAIHDDFKYSSLVKDLNRYYRSPSARRRTEFCKWKTDLRNNYMQSPWKTISIVVGGMILILTFIQTVCSILQLK